MATFPEVMTLRRENRMVNVLGETILRADNEIEIWKNDSRERREMSHNLHDEIMYG